MTLQLTRKLPGLNLRKLLTCEWGALDLKNLLTREWNQQRSPAATSVKPASIPE